jgi:ADP-ribosyl-[dinitrogen reductase] hydrolase
MATDTQPDCGWPADMMDRGRGCLLGLAVGDALGTSLEFSQRDIVPRHTEMTGGGPFGLAPGQWTDDTAMALALADSLLARGGLDARDLMDRFVAWWRKGEYSCTGVCFDIGLTTRGAPQAVEACELFAAMLREAILGAGRDAVLAPRAWAGYPAVRAVAGGSWRNKTRDQIRSTGYVVDTLEVALWAVARTDTFEDALVLAVNLGGDADTVGAVTGQLAGALHGADAIPHRWLEPLAWRERIAGLATSLAGAAPRE